jgi:pimeloyl-ACP methyl ester carboxylesterase
MPGTETTVDTIKGPKAGAVTVLADEGSGRAFVTVVDDAQYLPLAHAVVSALRERARTILVQSRAIEPDSWRETAAAFESVLASLQIRQASFVGLAAGATLVQNVALERPKVVRSLVIVDASLRPHPSVLERFLDGIEARLPFGLPLRLGSKGFNVRAFAHRLRCPMLLVSTARASLFVSREMQTLGSVAPTAWHVRLSSRHESAEAHELAELLFAFQDTPAKCPQKNLQAEAV